MKELQPVQSPLKLGQGPALDQALDNLYDNFPFNSAVPLQVEFQAPLIADFSPQERAAVWCRADAANTMLPVARHLVNGFSQHFNEHFAGDEELKFESLCYLLSPTATQQFFSETGLSSNELKAAIAHTAFQHYAEQWQKGDQETQARAIFFSVAQGVCIGARTNAQMAAENPDFLGKIYLKNIMFEGPEDWHQAEMLKIQIDVEEGLPAWKRDLTNIEPKSPFLIGPLEVEGWERYRLRGNHPPYSEDNYRLTGAGRLGGS